MWEDCPLVTRFKHLGVWIGRDVSLDDIYEEALTKLELHCSTHNPRSAPFHDRVLIWNIYIMPVLSYLMRFHTISPNLVTRVTRAAKKLLDPHRLLPISILLGGESPHPLLSEPVPLHPVPFAKRQSRRDGTIFPSSYPPIRVPRPSAINKKIRKFVSSPYDSTNFNTVLKTKGRIQQTYQLVIMNGLFVFARVHHFWNDFPSHCRLCGQPEGDSWPHMLTDCPTVLRTINILSGTIPDLHQSFSPSINDALMFTRPLPPEAVLNHLSLIHTIWVARYLASITNSKPSSLSTLFWVHKGKAVRQGLLKALRRASPTG